MARNPMQDIVPKGSKSIRNIPVPETRTRPIVRKAEPKPKKIVPAKNLTDDEIVQAAIRPKRPINLLDEEAVEKKVPERRSAAPVQPVREKKEIEIKELAKVERVERPSNWETLEEVRKEFEAKTETKEVEFEGEKKSRKGLKVFLTLAVVFGLGFGLSSFFDSATLLLVPRTIAAAVESDYSAAKSSGGAELSYDIITAKEAGSETLKATGERKVDRKATGTIVIYNNYTTSTQRLIKNTRFQTPEGLIFRITDSVTVPGKKGTTPGSIEAVVVADVAGEDYNVGLKDFTIPGFKGDPRYTSFYARAKTPMAGGFSGTEKVVSDTDRASAKAAIETKITAELLKRAPTLITSDKVTFDKAYKIVFTSLPDEVSGSEVTVKSEGVLSIVVFDRARMSEEIASAHIEDYAKEPIDVTNLSSLEFSPKGVFDPVNSNSIAFTLKGDANFEWQYDELGLKQALLGQPRNSVTEILRDFPTIQNADVSLRPAWSRSFPEALEKITVRKAGIE